MKLNRVNKKERNDKMKKVNNKLMREREGGLHYLAILLKKERREVFNLNNTSTSFDSTVGDYYE